MEWACGTLELENSANVRCIFCSYEIYFGEEIMFRVPVGDNKIADYAHKECYNQEGTEDWYVLE